MDFRGQPKHPGPAATVPHRATPGAPLVDLVAAGHRAAGVGAGEAGRQEAASFFIYPAKPVTFELVILLPDVGAGRHTRVRGPGNRPGSEKRDVTM